MRRAVAPPGAAGHLAAVRRPRRGPARRAGDDRQHRPRRAALGIPRLLDRPRGRRPRHGVAGRRARLRPRVRRRWACTACEADIRPENVPSQRLVERLGFQQEGLLRRYLDIDGDWRDHLAYALLAEDLPGGVLARWRSTHTTLTRRRAGGTATTTRPVSSHRPHNIISDTPRASLRSRLPTCITSPSRVTHVTGGVRMGSGVLLAALVVLWFVVLVPMVVTRGDAQGGRWNWLTPAGRCSGVGRWTPSSTPTPSASRSTATCCAPAVSCRWTCTPSGVAPSAGLVALAALAAGRRRWSTAPGCGRRRGSSTSPSSATCSCCARWPAASGWPPAGPPVPRPGRRCARRRRRCGRERRGPRDRRAGCCRPCRTPACRWHRCTQFRGPRRRRPHAGSRRLAAQRGGRSGRRRHRVRRHRRVPAAPRGQRLNGPSAPTARSSRRALQEAPVVAPGSRDGILTPEGAVAQSGSAPRSHRGGQGFNSPQLHTFTAEPADAVGAAPSAASRPQEARVSDAGRARARRRGAAGSAGSSGPVVAAIGLWFLADGLLGVWPDAAADPGGHRRRRRRRVALPRRRRPVRSSGAARAELSGRCGSPAPASR